MRGLRFCQLLPPGKARSSRDLKGSRTARSREAAVAGARGDGEVREGRWGTHRRGPGVVLVVRALRKSAALMGGRVRSKATASNNWGGSQEFADVSWVDLAVMWLV